MSVASEFTAASAHKAQKLLLWGVVGLIAITLIAVAFGQYQKRIAGPSAVESTEFVQSQMLKFADGPDASVVVSTLTDIEVARFDSGTNAFARVLLRGMGRERRLRDAPLKAPFQLARDTRGALYLIDPQTPNRITLDAFGSTNAAVFSDLLERAAAL